MPEQHNCPLKTFGHGKLTPGNRSVEKERKRQIQNQLPPFNFQPTNSSNSWFSWQLMALTGAVLLAGSLGQIAHEAIYCLFLSPYIFKGVSQIQIAPPPKGGHTILQTCYITMQQAMQAGAKIKTSTTTLTNMLLFLSSRTHIFVCIMSNVWLYKCVGVTLLQITE